MTDFDDEPTITRRGVVAGGASLSLTVIGCGKGKRWEASQVPAEEGVHEVIINSPEHVSSLAQLDAERADSPPKVFTRIHIHFVVTGHELRAAAVERAVKLSAEKYCSATLMLRDVVDITHDFELVEAG